MSDTNNAAVFVEQVIEIQPEIHQACGNGLPFEEPKRESSSPWNCGSKAWLESYKTQQLVDVFDVLVNFLGLSISGEVCANNVCCVHALRLTNYFLSTTWVKPLHSNSSTIIGKCVALLEFSLYDAANPVNDVALGSLKMLTKTVANDDKTSSLDSKYRWTFVHRFLSEMKRTVKRAESNLATYRKMLATSDLYRDIQPDINYVRKLAVHEILMHRMADMSTRQLFSLDYIIQKSWEVHPDLLMYCDGLRFKEMMTIAIHARLMKKLVEVNPRHCRCHAKCVGSLSDETKGLEQQLWKIYETHFSRLMCRLCRHPPTVESTTSDKPRKTYSSIVPETETCSRCRTGFKSVRLVAHDVRVLKNGEIYIAYSHRFFTTNSNRAVERVSGRKLTGPGARYFGICYGGRRSCMHRITQKVTSGQMPTYSCDVCTHHLNVTPSYDVITYSLAINSDWPEKTDKTCLRQYFAKSDFKKEWICRGCKIAVTCHHFDAALYRDPNLFDIGNFRRMTQFYKLRHWLSTADGWK